MFALWLGFEVGRIPYSRLVIFYFVDEDPYIAGSPYEAPRGC